MTVNDLLMIAAFRYVIAATVLVMLALVVVDVLWWTE